MNLKSMKPVSLESVVAEMHNPPTMKDINGASLKVGDTIRTSDGVCIIKEYLEAGTPRFGAVVRVEVGNLTMDIALLLSRAEYVRPVVQKDISDNDSKYGIK